MRIENSWVANVALVTVSSIIGFLACEAAYRSYLYATEPYQFLGDGDLWYFEKSPYRYNAEFGFEYVPGSYAGGATYEGRVIRCWDRIEEWEINEAGNSGRIKGSYDTADFRILAFGDSFTQRSRRAPNGDYMTWTNFLQDMLEEELKTSVHVVNFGRDAYGVLQMFDLASAKVRELKPHLAIIAFITADLTRGRFWRTTTFLDGRERIMTSEVPDPNPGWDTATDAYLVESKATPEWCHAALQSGVTQDPIVREMEAALRNGRRHSTLLADPFSLVQSFVLDRILHANAYYSTYESARPSQLPRHKLTDFAQDDRLVAQVNALRQSGVPYVLVHLATYKEISKQEEYASADSREKGLVESLADLTDLSVWRTLEHVNFPIENLEALPKSDGDEHPSLRGHQFYADVILEVLKRRGYVPRAD